MKKRQQLGLALALAAGTFSAVGGALTAENVVAYRQSMMIGLAWNIGAIGTMVKGELPWNQKKVAFLAARAAQLAPMAYEGFTPETAQAKSHAKAELWDNLKDFEQRNDTMVKAVVKLAEVSGGSDEDATKVAFMDTEKACKGCHEKNQEKE